MEKFNQINGVAALNNAEMETVIGGDGDAAKDLGYIVGYASNIIPAAASWMYRACTEPYFFLMKH